MRMPPASLRFPALHDRFVAHPGFDPRINRATRRKQTWHDHEAQEPRHPEDDGQGRMPGRE